MYRDIHTIKGNGGSYGFEFLSSLAHQAESLLEQLRPPVKIRRADLLASIIGNLNDMDGAAMEIRNKIQRIFGKDEEISIRVPESRVRKIREICARLSSHPDPASPSNDLIAECEMLSWKTLKTLTRKYQKIAQKAARKLEKNIEFSVVDELAFFAPETLLDVDDALIHIVRNAVDHGIERPDVREELSKGIGRITFEFSRKDGKKIIKVSDDGRGIDSEKLIESSIAKNVITPEEAAKMSEKEKLMLIFRSGVSTAETVTEISGRGMGMNIVEEKIRRLGGSIDIATEMGKGAAFTLIVPDAHTILQRT
jgi:two-component system chemotaxis sensor kinase CheA